MMKIQTLTTPTNVLTMMVIPVMIVQRVIMTHQMMDMTMMETVSVTQVTVMMTMTAARNVGIIAPDVDKNFTIAPAAVQSARAGARKSSLKDRGAFYLMVKKIKIV